MHDVRSACETLDPEMRDGLLGLWSEGRRGVAGYLEGGAGGGAGEGGVRDGGRKDGDRDKGAGDSGEEEEEETLGDAEWEAKFVEVGKMVEVYLRMRATTEKEKDGEAVLSKTLMERANEEKGRPGEGAEKKAGRMQARDEWAGPWAGRFEEIRAMRELEIELENGVWKA